MMVSYENVFADGGTVIEQNKRKKKEYITLALFAFWFCLELEKNQKAKSEYEKEEIVCSNKRILLFGDFFSSFSSTSFQGNHGAGTQPL